MKFSEFSYVRPNVDEACNAVNNLTEQFKKSTSAKEQIEIIAKYRDKLIEFGSMSSICHIRNTMNTNDEFYKAEMEFFDKNGPSFSKTKVDFGMAVLDSNFKEEIKKEYGEIFISNLEFSSKTMIPEIIPLLQEENALNSAYQQFNANAKVMYKGKEYTIPAISKLTISEDRTIRREAYVALSDFYRGNKDFYENTFDKLVKNRTAQANAMGFDSYTKLAYIRRNRNSYTPQDVEKFRKQIAQDIVPVIVKAKELQAKRIGMPNIKLFDNDYSFADGNPKGLDSAQDMMNATKEVFSVLSPITKEYIEFMMENECYDAPERAGKRVGAYCSSVPSKRSPFVFLNYNGSAGSIRTTFHEFGHGFNGYLIRNDPNHVLINTTMDICETHSMSMEFLVEPYLDKFFDNESDIKKSNIAHLEESLAFLSYGTMVDHFQHIIYDNPNLSNDERNEEWRKLEKIYRPYLDFDDIEFYSEGCVWQRQQHLYSAPFYYIDYVLAQTIALQFWQLASVDHEASLKKYIELTKMGGKLKFSDLVRSVGLKVPFEDGALTSIAQAVMKQLDK